MTYHIHTRLPSAAGFIALRAQTGWGELSLSQAKAALSASLCGVCATHDKAPHSVPIGMARVIGDGVLNLYIQDVIIAKSHRGQGLGARLMHDLISHLKATYPADCTIGLMAAKDQAPFYLRFGFTARPSAAFGAGMSAQLNHLG